MPPNSARKRAAFGGAAERQRIPSQARGSDRQVSSGEGVLIPALAPQDGATAAFTGRTHWIAMSVVDNEAAKFPTRRLAPEWLKRRWIEDREREAGSR